MASAVAVPMNVSRDSVQRIHRITRENRSLWYQLTVLQQPERARACGSGMKANSDRRPVDPPPVVELRIVEGPTVEEGKDITFDYNANFFLYASLEQARTLAHGRVQSAASTNPPILTGVPASGMAYLDRPAEAGYFIFPDLSVRHEGYFRLSFSLFETTKEEKDFDLEPTDPDLPPGVDWRMEIKTQPFNVFSAKKFPGLMESTQLSKTVADQGCRVRIRRDVRMRKRDGKGSAYDRGREEEYRRRTVTPASEDPHGIRARSLSNSSEHRLTYGKEPQRRPSGVDGYHPAPPPPPGFDNIPPSARGHLSFGEHAAPQYATPRQYVHPSQTNLHHMPPTAPPFPSTLSSPYAKPDQSPYGYPHHSRSISSACPSPALSVRAEAQYERATGVYVPASPSYASQQHSRRNSAKQISHPYPPVRPKQPQQQQQQQQPQQSAQHQKLSSRTTATEASLRVSIRNLVSPGPLSPIEPQIPTTLPPVSSPSAGDKRKHDDVFPHTQHSLHNGQRQHDAHFEGIRGMTPEPNTGTYSRADGQIGIVQFNSYQP